MSDLARPALSVVAPCYKEQDVLPELLRRVDAVLDSLGGYMSLDVLRHAAVERARALSEARALMVRRGFRILRASYWSSCFPSCSSIA